MNIPELLDELAARRIELWTDNGALKFRAPAGAFTAALKQAVSANKPVICLLYTSDAADDCCRV